MSLSLNPDARPEETKPEGKRVTVRLTPATYAGVLIRKLTTGQTIEQVVEAACAAYVAQETEGATP